MARNNHFQFKQFGITQEKAAMKVGIDGVLLGAWANFAGCERILDIGAGTGLIALMAAQKSEAIVDAVEVEDEAAVEAMFNFERSKWPERLNLVHLAFQDFSSEFRYDHIISNPPFFENSVKSKDEKRTKARHADSLSLQDLLKKSVQFLNSGGHISLVLPADKEERLRFLAPTVQLYINRFAYVSPDESKKPHRILVELGNYACVVENEYIYLRDKDTNEYTDQYKKITRDFYLAY